MRSLGSRRVIHVAIDSHQAITVTTNASCERLRDLRIGKKVPWERAWLLPTHVTLCSRNRDFRLSKSFSLIFDDPIAHVAQMISKIAFKQKPCWGSFGIAPFLYELVACDNREVAMRRYHQCFGSNVNHFYSMELCDILF